MQKLTDTIYKRKVKKMCVLFLVIATSTGAYILFDTNVTVIKFLNERNN